MHDASPAILRAWAPRVALVLLAFALRAWDFGNPVIHVDEQYYLLVGDRMLHGAVPYLDVWDRKPVGLFALYAAMRLLPGNGVLSYQLVATVFAAATAVLVRRGARQAGAGEAAALAAGAAYLLWLPLLSGRGGQSPVFYNLFTTAAAVLTLRLPGLSRPGAIVANGAAACLLAGLAIQTKYTPAVEGAMFGLAHLWVLRRAGAGWSRLAAAAALWMLLGMAPTLAVAGWYWRMGPAAFDAFWFANFTSIALRQGYPAAKIAVRLLGTTAQLLPLLACAAAGLRTRSPERCLAALWLAAALVAFAAIGAFFDHYALPLVAPLAIVAAPVWDRHRRALVASLAWGSLIFVAKTATRPHDATGARALAQVVARNDRGGCPFVYTGDAITYHLAHACLPTRYAFPSTLAYRSEQGATGTDEAAEVRRILAARPPVVVMTTRPLGEWNEATHVLVVAALARSYRPVFAVPRDDYRTIAYLRRDLPFVR